MAHLRYLPRSCFVEKKEIKLSIDKRTKGNNVLLTEIGSYKSFFMSLFPESIDWLRNSFKTLVACPRNNRFFQERRYDEYILWIEKTSNRRGCIAEIYRIDNKGRKCCIMIPEGYDKKGWVSFLNMISFIDNKTHKQVPKSII